MYVGFGLQLEDQREWRVQLVGPVSVEVPQRALGAKAYSLPSNLGMKTERGVPDPLFHSDCLHLTEESPRLLADGLVAGNEHDRHVLVAGDQPVESGLGQGHAVYEDVGDIPAPRVVEYRVGGPGLGMVSDEQHRVERLVDPFHHAERAA